MSFRFSSSKLCLTYSNVQQQQQLLDATRKFLSGDMDGSQPILYESLETTDSTIDAGELANFIRTRVGCHGIRYMVIATEQHKDGSRHFHCGISLEREYRSRDPRSLDYKGIHPNLQSARSFRRWVTYVKKDGDFIEEGQMSDNKPGPKQIIEMAKNMDKLEFLATMSTFKLQYAPTIWEMAHPDLTSTITDDDCLDTTKFVDPSILQFFLGNRWIEGKVLVMYGETGLGKTSMAKILIKKPALMVSHLDDLKKFRVGYHQGILFDDVSVKHIPETGQIHLVDWFEPRSIHVRYGTVFIPKHTPKIFTCNEYPLSDHSAITRRIQSVHVTNFK